MKRIVFAGIVMGVLMGLAGVALANMAVINKSGDDPAMMASPRTVVLGKVDSITIHTNIPASEIDENTLEVNGIKVTDAWTDDCGHIALRVAVQKLGLSAGETETLTLKGDLYYGPSFEVWDEVRVK